MIMEFMEIESQWTGRLTPAARQINKSTTPVFNLNLVQPGCRSRFTRFYAPTVRASLESEHRERTP